MAASFIESPFLADFTLPDPLEPYEDGLNRGSHYLPLPDSISLLLLHLVVSVTVAPAVPFRSLTVNR